jgi:hypothetical protein
MSTTKPLSRIEPGAWSLVEGVPAQDHLGEPKRYLVTLVQTRWGPRRERCATGDRRDVAENLAQYPESGPNSGRQAGNAKQLLGGGAKEAVLGDVGGVIVEPHEERDCDAEATSQLVLLAQSSSQNGERVVDLHISLKEPALDGALCLVGGRPPRARAPGRRLR